MSGHPAIPETVSLPSTARARVALACALHALQAVRAYPTIAATVQDALAPALAWTEGHPVAPAQLYEAIPRLFACEPAVQAEPAAKSALFAALAALYFCVWCANKVLQDPLPNDVADVDDSYVDSAMEYAAGAAQDPMAEASWQAELVRVLLRAAKAAP